MSTDRPYLRLVEALDEADELVQPVIEGTMITPYQLLQKARLCAKMKTTKARWLRLASALFQEGYGPLEGMEFPVSIPNTEPIGELEEQLLTMNDMKKVSRLDLLGKNVEGFWVQQTNQYPISVVDIIYVHVHFNQEGLYLVDRSSGERRSIDDLPDGSALYLRVTGGSGGGGGREALPMAA